MSGAVSDVWRARLAAAASRSDLAAVRALFAAARAERPNDAPLLNSIGNALNRLGDPHTAALAFGQAMRLAPEHGEFAINAGIALAAAGRHGDALETLAGAERHAARDPRFWSVRANSARATGRLDDAARWYDRTLTLQPGHPRALHGRARVALERDEPGALARYDAVLVANPQDAAAWLGKVEALDAAGRLTEARALAEQLVAAAPHWIEALQVTAQLRMAAGDADFDAVYAEAAARQPGDPAIPAAHAAALASHDLFGRAAEVAGTAHRRFPADAGLALAHASHASAAGDLTEAERLFAALDAGEPAVAFHAARHAVRRGDPARADRLLDTVMTAEPWNIAAWALRGLVWRLNGDARAEWLHGRDGIVRPVALPDADDVLAEAVPVLRSLHDRAPLPLGQSLRGGTQTRGALFAHHAPALRRLRDAIAAAVETYRSALPPPDPSHPLLRHRDTPFTFSGSWSVRLRGAGGGRHVAHIHPEGVVSSALYCALPDAMGAEPGAGVLELGRPPADLRCDLPPVATIVPRRGTLALFPSTLYHGTAPFSEGERLTVAFDLVPATGPGAGPGAGQA